VLKFWFEELTREQWFTASQELDELIRARFSTVHAAAVQGELFSWRASASGRLAEIIVLDQFSRNIHRGTPGAFRADAMALALAQEMVSLKLDQEIAISQRAFAYM